MQDPKMYLLTFRKTTYILAENKIIVFLSSEGARADCREVSDSINNWVKLARHFLASSISNYIMKVSLASGYLIGFSYYFLDI
jgi:hypothetical protein